MKNEEDIALDGYADKPIEGKTYKVQSHFTLNHEEVKALLRELEREYITEENPLAKHVVRRMQNWDREQHFNKI